MSGRRASDLLVSCLEAEGVPYVFGVPGEETVDLNESLSRSTVRFVPQASYAQSALVAGTGQSILIDVDGASDPSLVIVQMRKAGGGAGNGFTSPAAVVLSLTFEVLGSGGSTLSFAGVGAFPAQALESTGQPIDAVRFDAAGASIAGVRSGGGGY